MPSGVEIVFFLEWLEKEYESCSFVLVPADAITDFPWLRKYAWISGSYIKEVDGEGRSVPKEMPITGDKFFIAARNLSCGSSEILFECGSRKGKIRFDYAEADGIFRKNLFVVAGGAPVDDMTSITVLEVDSTSDLIHVRSSLVSGEEAHDKPLIFRF
jgi:hypothetical protein